MAVWSLHSSLPQEEVLPFPQNEGMMIPPSQKSQQRFPVKNSQNALHRLTLHEFFCDQSNTLPQQMSCPADSNERA